MAILVVAIPIVFSLGVLLISNLNRVANHQTTTGVVVDLIAGTDSDGDVTYTPVYEYSVSGSTYRYTSSVSYGGLLVPEIGDTRTILYDPGDPRDARIRNVFVLIWLPIILIGIATLIVFIIFWAMRRRRRVADQAPPWAEQIPAEQPEWSTQPPWDAPSPAPASPSETLEATFMGTEPSQMDDQGRVRYRVKARVEIDGQMHRFRSDWVDEDPTLYYMQHGNKVEVRVDPNDLTRYEVVLPQVE